jgi:hypothetical protein
MEQQVSEFFEKETLDKLYQNFRGTARIQFTSLQFDYQVDENQVTRLHGVFGREGCKRHLPQNRIAGKLSQAALDDAIRLSPGITSEILLNEKYAKNPELTFANDFKIKCSGGLHRVEAAKKYLHSPNWWWSIDIFIEIDGDDHDNYPIDLEGAMRNEYGKPRSEGEIYLEILRYRKNPEHLGAYFAEQCLWARLSIDKRKALKRILNHKDYAPAFYDLRVMVGMWAGFQIDHKWLAMKCEDVGIRAYNMQYN